MNKPERKNRKAKVKPLFSFVNEFGVRIKLTPKQKSFCDCYIKLRGNGRAAAFKAGYAGSEKALRVVASRNLTNVNLLAYIRTLLDKEGLTDEAADLELLWAMQQSDNISGKVQAIREYNKIKGRHAPEKIEGAVKVIRVGVWKVEKGDRDRD